MTPRSLSARFLWDSLPAAFQTATSPSSIQAPLSTYKAKLWSNAEKLPQPRVFTHACRLVPKFELVISPTLRSSAAVVVATGIAMVIREASKNSLFSCGHVPEGDSCFHIMDVDGVVISPTFACGLTR